MLSPSKVILFLAVAIFGAETAFQSRTMAELAVEEVERYERIRKAPGVKQARLVALDDARLTKSDIRLDFFNGLREDFRMEEGRERNVWVGRSGKNFDRLVIRKSSRGYSGHILAAGRKYVVVPIKAGVSALYEIRGGVDCGLQSIPEANP